MAIAESEVEVCLSGPNVSYWQNKKQRPSYNITRMSSRTRIIVDVNDLPNGSNIKVTKICDLCQETVGKVPYNNVLKSRGKTGGLDICKNCTCKILWNYRIKNMKNEDSLASKFFHLIDEWDYSKNKADPTSVHTRLDKKYWWICNTCGSNFEMRPNDRLRSGSCPYCNGKRINHTNNLWTTNPEVAELLWNKDEGFRLTKGTHKSADFKCVDCGRKIPNKKVKTIVRMGLFCPICSDGTSLPEKFFMCVLDQCNIEYETEKVFRWSGRKRYDFYLPSINMIVEIHGKQHYTGSFERFGGNNLEQEEKNDSYKKNIALTNKIEHYAEIDCFRIEMKYIKNNILNSQLSMFLDLSDIDWELCELKSQRSLVKVVCDLFKNEKLSSSDIENRVKLEKSAIIRYLKKGSELGFCDYDPIEEMRKSANTNRQNQYRAVLRFDMSGTFVDEFQSTSEAARAVNRTSSNVVMNCKRKYKSSGGFIFRYKDEFENKKYILY